MNKMIDIHPMQEAVELRLLADVLELGHLTGNEASVRAIPRTRDEPEPRLIVIGTRAQIELLLEVAPAPAAAEAATSAPAAPHAHDIQQLAASGAGEVAATIDNDEFWSHVIAYCKGTGNEGQALVDYVMSWNRAQLAAAPAAPHAQAEPVGEIRKNDHRGWHMHALKPWDEIGLGTKLYAVPVSAGAAAKIEQASMQLCPRCQGSGEGKMMVGGGPDAYEIDSNCEECGGIGEVPASAAGAGSEQPDERALFEAWARTEGNLLESRLETGGKIYVSSLTRRAWVVWQARAALARAPLPEQDDDARDAARYRWLRSQDTSLETQQRDTGIVNGPSCYHEVEGIRELKWGAELDKALDAAMSASRPDDKAAEHDHSEGGHHD
jgi:hypothetical protein